MVTKKKILVSIIIISYVLLIVTFVKKYSADVNYQSADDLFQENHASAALIKINESISQNPLEPEYYRQRAKIYILLNNKESALSDLQTSYDLNPTNLATIRDNVPLYFFLANRDLSQPASLENIDYDFLPIVQSYFMQTKEYFSNDAGVQIAVAKYEKRLGLTEDYEKSMKNIKSLRPDLLEWHPDLIN